MIPTGLIKALADEVREATKDYVMKAEGQEDKKVSVYCQHIPDEDFQTDTYYPLVIISVQDVVDEGDGISTATIGMTIGVYPNKWETVEAQPYPFWFGYGTVKYRVGHPNPQGGLLWQ